MEELEWKDSLVRILEKDSRYDAHAYIFMNGAVSYTVNKLSKLGRPLGTRHVTGGQLIQGMLEYAVSTYMFLAPDMLRYWNLLSGRDAGNIVYNLIEEGVLSAGPNDRIEDAIAALTDARKQTSNEVLEKNRELLLNGKVKQFSNAPLAEAWYALMLEEPKMPRIQQSVRYR